MRPFACPAVGTADGDPRHRNRLLEPWVQPRPRKPAARGRLQSHSVRKQPHVCEAGMLSTLDLPREQAARRAYAEERTWPEAALGCLAHPLQVRQACLQGSEAAREQLVQVAAKLVSPGRCQAVLIGETGVGVREVAGSSFHQHCRNELPGCGNERCQHPLLS